MTLTDQQYQDLIMAYVGGDTADGLLATNIPILWEVRASIADSSVRALWVRMDAIDMLLGQAARQVTFKTSSGSSVNLSDLFDHFKQLRESTAGLLASAVGGGGIAIGALSTTAPIMPSAREPDPNARRLRGDPLKRRV